MNTLFRAARLGWCTTLLVLATAAQAQTTHIVTVGDSFFSPSQITIQAGDTVRWTNAAGGMNHDVTADDGSFGSATTTQFTFDVTFNDPGENPYHCTVHGAAGGFGMSGNVTVEGGGGGGPGFDLALSEVSVDSNPVYSPGDSVPIDAEVNNLGPGTSTTFAVDFYASTDFNITSGDIFLGSASRGALGAGNDDNISVSLDLPGNLAQGNYFIGAILDVDDANAGNNSNADDETITVDAGAPFSDLVLQSVNAPNGPHQQGSTFAVQSTTTNIGNAVSSAYTITFYASDNNIISDSDTAIGSEGRAALAAGASHTGGVNVTIPANLATGQYFIGAIVDVVDANAANNVNLDQVAVQVTPSTVPGFVINAGLNDAWFNALTSGQGFFITVFPDAGVIFLAWFTYDTERPDPAVAAILGEAGHRWLTAFGAFEGNIATLQVELTEGGVFNATEPMPTQDPNYGTIELEFIDCNSAIVRYNFPGLGLMGEIPITRIADDNIPRCLAEQPQ